MLKKAVKKAHAHDLKVYLALNTLIKDSEVKDVKNFLKHYLEFCSDGIIIQDLGLYRLVKKLYPEVRLHASTQMNVHNLRSVLLMKKLGFKRVILARELTLDEIKHIRKKCDIEIEIFAHGSQCYSYSGSCYFSSFTGSRSGNRGRCTQPCRMKYSIITSESRVKANNKTRYKENILLKDSYLLSKSDLSTLEILPDIISSGIDALKIEGRMKTAEYVGIVTKIYRKYIDMYYRSPCNYRVEKEDIDKINQIFSRELNTGYFLEEFPEKIVSFKKSGSIGNFVGRIIKLEKKEIFIRSKTSINKGDIIEIWTNRGNEHLKISNFEVSGKKKTDTIYKIRLKKDIKLNIGDRVFKFFDAFLDKEAKSLYANGLSKVEE
jgi:putative protease